MARMVRTILIFHPATQAPSSDVQVRETAAPFGSSTARSLFSGTLLFVFNCGPKSGRNTISGWDPSLSRGQCLFPKHLAKQRTLLSQAEVEYSMCANHSFLSFFFFYIIFKEKIYKTYGILCIGNLLKSPAHLS